MSQSFTNLLYHLIFSTKNREPWINEAHRPRLYDYIGGIIHAADGVPLGINGTADHVHVLAKLGPSKALADVLRDLKANASGWLHGIFPELHDFSWQRGYAAFTVSQSHLDKVRKYIAQQQEHHKRVSFKDEFKRFLMANEIEFDPRYLV